MFGPTIKYGKGDFSGRCHLLIITVNVPSYYNGTILIDLQRKPPVLDLYYESHLTVTP